MSNNKIGLPPGSMVYVGAKSGGPSEIQVYEYSEERISSRIIPSEDIAGLPEKDCNCWLNIWGVHDIEAVKAAGNKYKVDPFILEDILNTAQRPKIEISDDSIFVVMKMIRSGEERHVIEQCSFYLTGNTLITFQEEKGDVFESIRKRLENQAGLIRKNGPDFLMYAMIDILVDQYYPVIQQLSDRLDALEEEIFASTRTGMLDEIQMLRREMIFLKKNLWPVKEIVASLTREDGKLISIQTRKHLRDVHDHTLNLIDDLEMLRDLLSGVHDSFMTVAGNRMNEAMKVLTIISTIFIPLSFLAGVYGMNFEYMPELSCRFGYPILLITMIFVVSGMLLFFRRKKWI
ncbi:MAG: magnesium/cobalt transporter CorA [Candidatus Wallbacteria bacterium]|nr:magnesium/cobalt transporter CorA [Candidatus Wallbacteria bacterium]